MVTLLEAVAWRGLDNVIIPLGVFLLLHIYTAMPEGLLVYRFIAACALLVFVLLYRRRTTLEASALLASALVLYASWGVGGWPWLIAPAVLFACYSYFLPGNLLRDARKDNVYAVTSVASAGLLWLYLAKLDGHAGFLFPYTVGYTIHLAILAWTLGVLRDPAQSPWKSGPMLLIRCWVLMFAPYLFLRVPTMAELARAAAALPLCGLAFAVFCIFEPRRDGLYCADGWRWLREGALVLLFTAPLALLGGSQ